MKVHIVPILRDNFSYLICSTASHHNQYQHQQQQQNAQLATVVDPAEPVKVIAALNQHGLRATTVLTTHKHEDHAGGNEQMAKLVPGIEIVGAKMELIPGLTRPVEDDECFTLPNGLRVQVLFTPCHTLGHVVYRVLSDVPGQPDAIFVGDTLFVGGCGRFFEGNAAMMYQAVKRITALPPETLMYCGHEYTVQNLEWALKIEPDNPNLRNKLEWARSRRQRNEPTVPSTLAEEMMYNPFLRVENPAIQARMGTTGDPIRTMAELRESKNRS